MLFVSERATIEYTQCHIYLNVKQLGKSFCLSETADITHYLTNGVAIALSIQHEVKKSRICICRIFFGDFFFCHSSNVHHTMTIIFFMSLILCDSQNASFSHMLPMKMRNYVKLNCFI